MKNITRRELLQQSTMLAAAARPAIGETQATPADMSTYEWIRSTRILIAEAYNPPFYPALDYRAEKAVSIAREVNADALRYPSASYFAYFPTRSRYPIHPELKGDPMRETVELSKQAGLRVVAYVPLNHPFMDSTSKDPRYADWSKKFANGKPMITSHYGYATFFEGCLNSPVREVIRTLVREVLTQYAVDVMYLFEPHLGAKRSYQIEYQPGLTSHVMASKNAIVLHLLANTGNKNKHLRARESFLPVADVKVRIKVPSQPKSVSLLHSGDRIPVTQNSGWIELTVPRVLIHEAVGVDLG